MMDEGCFLGPNGEVHFGALIKRINDTMEKHANNALQQHDITSFQLKMLIILVMSEDGTATLKELERGFGVAQSTAAGVAVRLEKKGLITSFSDVRDRRVKRAQITPAGRTLCMNHREEMDRDEARLTKALSPEEQEQLKALLLRVYDSLAE
ncbi:MAG: MarR family transcriptional regulator [Oscillospiraceae bacterium]|nr:MarR family transcriptional regulator [Oscillospiraceae bacterium]